MIKIKFLENYNFLVKFNGDLKNFNNYIRIITTKLLYCAKPNIERTGGWIFSYDKLDEVVSYFNDVVYENEYTPPVYFEMGKDMKLQPYLYQKEAIYFAIENKEALMVLPCGSGKTPIAIGIYLEALTRGIVSGQGLIVVKASLKSQWKKEVSKFSDLEANIIQTYADRCSKWTSKMKKLENKIKKLPVTSEDRKNLAEELKALKEEADIHFNSQFDNGDLLIANYETLLDEKVLERLIAKKLECVICDEIHYAKTHTAERSKALYKLTDAKIKIGATATPITKDPRDVYGIFKFIKPDIFGKVGEFQKKYIQFAGYGRINGFKNMDTLKEKISNNIFLKTKEEVASQLPSLIVSQKYCELNSDIILRTEEMLQELEELNNEDFNIRRKCKSEAEALLNEELQKIQGKIMALQTFCQEICNSPLLLAESDSEMSRKYAEGIDMKHNAKMDLCLELVDEILESGEKVIIFSKFERMQGILTDAINKKYNSKKENVKIAYVNGSISGEARYEEAYTKFKENDDYKILLCSDAGAEGRFMPSLNIVNCGELLRALITKLS